MRQDGTEMTPQNEGRAHESRIGFHVRYKGVEEIKAASQVKFSGNYADDPVLDALANDLIRSAPNELQEVMRTVFVGDVPSNQANAWASYYFGAPHIAVSPILTTLFGSTSGLLESYVIQERFKETGSVTPPDGDEVFYLKAPGEVGLSILAGDARRRERLRNPEPWLELISYLMELSAFTPGTQEYADRALTVLQAIDICEGALADWEKERILIREYWAYAFTLAHEYAHILLGHKSQNGEDDPVREQQIDVARKIMGIVVHPQQEDPTSERRNEREADTLGAALVKRLLLEHENPILQAQQMLEGVMVGLICISLVSGGVGSETHPPADERLAAVTKILLDQMDLISLSPADDVGPRGPGFSNRIRQSSRLMIDLASAIIELEVPSD